MKLTTMETPSTVVDDPEEDVTILVLSRTPGLHKIFVREYMERKRVSSVTKQADLLLAKGVVVLDVLVKDWLKLERLRVRALKRSPNVELVVLSDYWRLSSRDERCFRDVSMLRKGERIEDLVRCMR